jgi:hypothetical protein
MKSTAAAAAAAAAEGRRRTVSSLSSISTTNFNFNNMLYHQNYKRHHHQQHQLYHHHQHHQRQRRYYNLSAAAAAAAASTYLLQHPRFYYCNTGVSVSVSVSGGAGRNLSLFVAAMTTEGYNSKFFHSSSASNINKINAVDDDDDDDDDNINVNNNADAINNFWNQHTTDVNNNQKRRYSSSSSSTKTKTYGNNDSLLNVVETLARRLNAPIPLRAAVTTAAANKSNTGTTTTTTTTTSRLSELANELSQGYVSLPSLRLTILDQYNPKKPVDNKDSKEGEATHCQRSEIINFLGTKCGSSSETEIDKAVEQYCLQRSSSKFNNIDRLRKVTTPIHETIIDFILKQNAVTGMEFIIDLREDLLLLIRYFQHQQEENDSNDLNQNQKQKTNLKVLIKQYKQLDTYIKLLLQKWFVPGLLEHERITYEETSASVIEYIAKHEAVHPMKSLNDLRNRLNPSSRRVYALFHPSLPQKPLVFVHVALLSSLAIKNNDDDKLFVPSSMNDVMGDQDEDNDDHNNYDTAVFYSISNGVKGLSGVGLGEYLLKESIHALLLQRENNESGGGGKESKIKTFITLSPIPKFRNWLKIKLLQLEQQQQQHQRQGDSNDCIISKSIISSKDREELFQCGLLLSSSALPILFPWEEFWNALENDIDFTKLQQAAAMNEPSDNIITSQQRQRQRQRQYIVLQSILCKLVCQYLVHEKYRGKPLDKVCGFHIGNGAEIYDIHFCADLSRNGLNQSYGIMVNYIYHVDTNDNNDVDDDCTNNNQIQDNQTNYECNSTISISSNIQRWLDLD